MLMLRHQNDVSGGRTNFGTTTAVTSMCCKLLTDAAYDKMIRYVYQLLVPRIYMETRAAPGHITHELESATDLRKTGQEHDQNQAIYTS